MRRTLHDHIVYLEQTVQSFRDQLTRPTLTLSDREHIHTELKTAELALAHYRKAHELEERIAGDGPAPSAPQPKAPAPSDSNRDNHSPRDRSKSHHRRVPVVTRTIPACARAPIKLPSASVQRLQKLTVRERVKLRMR